jgi:hypothetical protein
MAILMDVLLRRAIPAVLVLVIAFAPAALIACQAVCAAPALGVASPAAHSCHGPESAAAAVTTLVAIPHECGHVQALPVTAFEAPQLVLQPPAITAADFSLSHVLAAVLIRTPQTSARKSVPIVLTLPLRV